MQSPSNPFDFSEYSSSRDGSDIPSSDPSGSPWGSSAPTFGFASDPFGSSADSSLAAPSDMFSAQRTGIEQGRTPIAWVAGATGVALLSLALGLFTVGGWPVWSAVGGWVLTWLAAFLLAKHISADTRERARAVYQKSAAARVAYVGAAVLTFAGILLNAWQIAEWAGRL